MADGKIVLLFGFNGHDAVFLKICRKNEPVWLYSSQAACALKLAPGINVQARA
jgi:hypothetical protein